MYSLLQLHFIPAVGRRHLEVYSKTDTHQMELGPNNTDEHLPTEEV